MPEGMTATRTQKETMLGVQLSKVMDLQRWANHLPEVSTIQRNTVSLGNSGRMEEVSEGFPNAAMAMMSC